MGKRADEILEQLGGATPAMRRYARALCAGAGSAVADDLVQNALQSVGARMRARELRPADAAEARLEAYGALTALAARKLPEASRPASRQPPIVHGLAGLAFDDRAVLLLVSLEAFGYDAVARIVGASREAVLARLRRARAALATDEDPRLTAPAEGGARRAAAHLRIVK